MDVAFYHNVTPRSPGDCNLHNAYNGKKNAKKTRTVLSSQLHSPAPFAPTNKTDAWKDEVQKDERREKCKKLFEEREMTRGQPKDDININK